MKMNLRKTVFLMILFCVITTLFMTAALAEEQTQTGLPDLMITKVFSVPAHPNPGEQATIVLYYKNFGNATAAKDFYIYGSTECGGIEYGQVEQEIKPGEENAFYWGVVQCEQLPKILTFKIDTYNTVQELNEGNNEYQYSIPQEVSNYAVPGISVLNYPRTGFEMTNGKTTEMNVQIINLGNVEDVFSIGIYDETGTNALNWCTFSSPTPTIQHYKGNKIIVYCTPKDIPVGSRVLTIKATSQGSINEGNPLSISFGVLAKIQEPEGNTTQCVSEGKKGSYSNADVCCANLKKVTNLVLTESGLCIASTDDSFICANCGNGVCGLGENKCNCPQDCGSTTISCTDTDGGKNYYVRGETYTYIEDSATHSVDTCIDASNLREYYCENGIVANDIYPCKFGCENGACKTTSPSFFVYLDEKFQLGENQEATILDYNKMKVKLNHIYTIFPQTSTSAQGGGGNTSEISTQSYVNIDVQYTSESKNRIILHRDGKYCKNDSIIKSEVFEVGGDTGYWNFQCKNRKQEQCYDDGSFDTYYDEWCEYPTEENTVSSGTNLNLKVGETETVFGADITLLDISNNTATFIVTKKVYNPMVDIGIEPRTINVGEGEKAVYRITVKDNHPVVNCAVEEETNTATADVISSDVEVTSVVKCPQPLHEYTLKIIGLPFEKVFPQTISLASGEKKEFDLIVYTNSTINTELINETGIIEEASAQAITELASSTQQAATNLVTDQEISEAIKSVCMKSDQDYGICLREQLKAQQISASQTATTVASQGGSSGGGAGVAVTSTQQTTCPLYSTPAPDWCKDGKIIDGGIDSNGCALPPQCIGIILPSPYIRSYKFAVKITDGVVTNSAYGTLNVKSKIVEPSEGYVIIEVYKKTTIVPLETTTATPTASVVAETGATSAEAGASAVQIVEQPPYPKTRYKLTLNQKIMLDDGTKIELAALDKSDEMAVFGYELKTGEAGMFRLKKSETTDVPNTVYLVILREIYFQENNTTLTQPELPSENAQIKLVKGWNLVSLSGNKIIKFLPTECSAQQKLTGFVYLKSQKKYASFPEAQTILGDSFMDYISKNAFWIYSYTDCDLNFEMETYLKYNELNLEEGWNLMPITNDMIGNSLSQINNNCDFQKMYKWNPSEQKWEKLEVNYVFSENDQYTGIAVKSNNYCQFGGEITISNPPDLPE